MTESTDRLQQHLAAIVEGSDDAIITKDLDSIILTWNRAAERIFGYTAEEAVGRPITMLIPDDRQDEEVDFIARLRRGERIHHYETIRKKKGGKLVPISVTISPIRDETGRVIGASKIARDITLQHRAAEQQRMLLSEMRHRVANSFAVASALLNICARQADSVDGLVELMRGRFRALSSAHSLAVRTPDTALLTDSANLSEIVSTILAPFTGKIVPHIDIAEIKVAPEAITPLALLFYELCTNAVKYGALSQENGRLSIVTKRQGDRLIIQWSECCAFEHPHDEKRDHGFGTTLCESVIQSYLNGSIAKEYSAQGMNAILDLCFEKVAGKP